MLEHDYAEYANQTHQWIGTDSKERFLKHCKDKEKWQYFETHGYLDKNVIRYQFNEYGFRCAPWDNIQEHSIALGCSHTQGVGIASRDTWSTQLSKLLNKSILNLGIGGASLDTCLRVLMFAVEKLRINTVYLLEPEAQRLEFAINNQWQVLTVNYNHDVFKNWVVEQKNVEMNQLKNRLAIQQVCDKNGLQLKTIMLDDIKKLDNIDWARDFAHNGPEWNKSVAQAFADL